LTSLKAAAAMSADKPLDQNHGNRYRSGSEVAARLVTTYGYQYS